MTYKADCDSTTSNGSGPMATLDDVDIRDELESRPIRPKVPGSEDQALAALAKEMAENPRNMLQKLAETARQLCDADTAGISLLETHGAEEVFRWEALAGVFASYRNNTMPRYASPCGTCIDRNDTQLMYLADRCFPALRTDPRFVEALLIPFHVNGEPIGTVWVVAHQPERKFDREDERVVRTLASFASAGWQLWKAYEAAEAANHRKDEFLAILGHELRNPLAAIQSAVEVLRLRGTEDATNNQTFDIVGRQAQHLSTMIDDLLDLSRIAAGKLKLKKEPTNLAVLVDQALEAMRARIESRGHQLSVDLPAAPLWIDADGSRMVQLLTNLLDNAAKYTPDGGQIQLSVQSFDTQVEISVRDSGVGIPREKIPLVFELFTQLDDSPESSHSGLGLGLTLVRRFAEMHGGAVAVSSDGPGKGSQFRIRLPKAFIATAQECENSKRAN